MPFCVVISDDEWYIGASYPTSCVLFFYILDSVSKFILLTYYYGKKATIIHYKDQNKIMYTINGAVENFNH
jgi:hypothetical protein